MLRGGHRDTQVSRCQAIRARGHVCTLQMHVCVMSSLEWTGRGGVSALAPTLQ